MSHGSETQIAFGWQGYTKLKRVSRSNRMATQMLCQSNRHPGELQLATALLNTHFGISSRTKDISQWTLSDEVTNVHT